jgi:hypothetical protein
VVDNYIAKATELQEEQILTELEKAKELPEKRKKEIEIEETSNLCSFLILSGSMTNSATTLR